MKHTLTEVYQVIGIHNKLFSEEAVKNLKHVTRYSDAEMGDAIALKTRVATAKPFRIYDAIDTKVFRYGYQYGEKIWFDTVEELEEYRTEEKTKAMFKKIASAKIEIAKNLKILKDLGLTKEEIDVIINL